MIHLQKSSSYNIGFSVRLKFQITQHNRDTPLMKSLVEYLGCGGYKERLNGVAGDVTVIRFTDINEKIIPFFNKYPLQGVKSHEFASAKHWDNECKRAFNWSRVCRNTTNKSRDELRKKKELGF